MLRVCMSVCVNVNCCLPMAQHKNNTIAAVYVRIALGTWCSMVIFDHAQAVCFQVDHMLVHACVTWVHGSGMS